MGNNNNFCTFYIVRHGETEWNIKGKIQGQKDSSLTSNGIVQAQKAASRFKKVLFDKVFSSDLLRAKRTAEIIALEHKLAVKTNELLRERSFGKLEGRKGKEVKKELKKALNKRKKLSRKGKFSFKIDREIETDKSLARRFRVFLEKTALAHPKQTILVVSHGGIISAFLIKLGYAEYEQWPAASIINNGYLIIESNGKNFAVIKSRGVTKRK